MVRVLSLCAKSELGKIDENVDRYASIIREFSKEQPVDLVVMFEMATSGFMFPDMKPYSETTDSRTFSVFHRLSEEIGALVGWGYCENNGDFLPYNSLALVDGSKLIGIARKSHLGPSRPGAWGNEFETFTPGEELALFDTRIGKLGFMICMDGGFPEVARVLTLKGADILVWSSRSWGQQGRMNWPAVRACENVIPMVHCDGSQDPADQHRHPVYWHAMICNHIGEILAESKYPQEILYAELDLDIVKSDRKHGPGPKAFLRVRRPDMYGEICRNTGTGQREY